MFLWNHGQRANDAWSVLRRGANNCVCQSLDADSLYAYSVWYCSIEQQRFVILSAQWQVQRIIVRIENTTATLRFINIYAVFAVIDIIINVYVYFNSSSSSFCTIFICVYFCMMHFQVDIATAHNFYSCTIIAYHTRKLPVCPGAFVLGGTCPGANVRTPGVKPYPLYIPHHTTSYVRIHFLSKVHATTWTGVLAAFDIDC